MREHAFDTDEAALRPKSGRIESPVTDGMGLAAAEGRTDVLGSAGILGLQRTAGNESVTSMLEEGRSPVHDVLSSGGQPLDADTRTDMEGRLGHDFGDVRVHDDGAAHDSARAVNAHAYTVGSHVVFQRDHYDPSSDAGRTMLAHELTHVVQQRQGDVDGESRGGGIKVSTPDDKYEQQAEATADAVMSGGGGDHAGHDHSAGGVQREAEDEATAQTLPIQREAAGEEEAAEEESVSTLRDDSIQREAAGEEEAAEEESVSALHDDSIQREEENEEQGEE
jgi:hypothetical protein